MELPRRARAATAAALVALLAGCGEEPFPPEGAAVEQARERAQTQTASVVELYENMGTPLAQGSSDGCAVGQRNWKVDDGFDMLCAQSTASVVGLNGVDPRQAARAALIPPAGCRAGVTDVDDPVIREQKIDAFSTSDASVTVAGRHTCGRADVHAVAVRTRDRSLEAEILEQPYSLPKTIQRRPLSATLDRAAAQNYDFLIVVTARAEYVRR